ncbi:MAG: tyrosine-type recombinase/integrase [Clostridia bacterium]
MTNDQLIIKLKKDMQMRNFSHYTYDAYLSKTKEMIRYFKKPMEEITTEELRNFLQKHLKEERKLSDRSINYYNSVIRFVYEVTLDKILNKKQLPMRKQKRTVYKVLTKEELSTFFNCVDNFKFKTIFMLAYGSGLRIGEIANLREEDIDGKNMRIFVREGKGNKERYTILSKKSLEMLRIYWSKYRQNKRRGRIFLSESGAAITVGVIREHFRQYRRKAKLSEKVTMHTLRHCFATNLIENGVTLIQVKELMGHSNIRSTMEYIHVANIDLEIENPLDVFMKGEK